MFWQIFKQISFTAIFVLYLMLNAMNVSAESKTVEADGEYTAGEGLEENFSVAKERARLNAMRNASEKVGVFVESISKASW